MTAPADQKKAPRTQERTNAAQHIAPAANRAPAAHKIMWQVCLALLPGVAAMTYVWGWGVLWNVAWLVALCAALESLLNLRAQRTTVTDGSAVLTALLIAICLPPSTDLQVLLVAALFAICLAKFAYGGLGRNLFNPAMVGYAAVLVSFPTALSQWPNASDALTGATLLTEFRYREGLTTAEFLGRVDSRWNTQLWIAGAFALGGVVLILLKIIHWRMPAAVALGLAVAAAVGYDQGSSASNGGLVFHLICGGTVAAMFFVATDPVTMPEDRRYQWLFGVIVGGLIYTIRTWGAYPDGIAFSILLANCLTPIFDRLARHQVPRLNRRIT